MIKGVTHAHSGPIWYLSEPSDTPYSSNPFLALDLGLDFFAVSYGRLKVLNDTKFVLNEYE